MVVLENIYNFTLSLKYEKSRSAHNRIISVGIGYLAQSY